MTGAVAWTLMAAVAILGTIGIVCDDDICLWVATVIGAFALGLGL